MGLKLTVLLVYLLAGCPDDVPLKGDQVTAVTDGPLMETPWPDLWDATIGDLAPDGAGPAPGPVCSKDKWCWENPRPQGNTLWAVWVEPGSGKLWAAGAHGTLLRYDGAHLRAVPSPVTQTIEGLWGSNPTDLYAVGDDHVLHFDGKTWVIKQTFKKDYLQGVWGSGPTYVFVVGGSGRFLRHDGVTWFPITGALGVGSWLRGIWGSGPSNVCAVGWGGTIIHNDGKAWKAHASSTVDRILLGVWGTGPTNVFAVGTEGVILRYDGEAWSNMTSPTKKRLTSLWGTGPTNIWAAGYEDTMLRFDGKVWKKIKGPALPSGDTNLDSLWGTGPSNVYAVGFGGVIFRFDGKTWTRQASGTSNWLETVNASDHLEV